MVLLRDAEEEEAVCPVMTYPPLYYAVEKVLDLLLMTWSEQTRISLPSTVFKLAAHSIFLKNRHRGVDLRRNLVRGDSIHHAVSHIR